MKRRQMPVWEKAREYVARYGAGAAKRASDRVDANEDSARGRVAYWYDVWNEVERLLAARAMAAEHGKR